MPGAKTGFFEDEVIDLRKENDLQCRIRPCEKPAPVAYQPFAILGFVAHAIKTFGEKAPAKPRNLSAATQGAFAHCARMAHHEAQVKANRPQSPNAPYQSMEANNDF